MSIKLCEMALEVIGQKILVIGGQWDGSIKLVNMETNKLVQEVRDSQYTVTVISKDKEENQLVTGDKIGMVVVY